MVLREILEEAAAGGPGRDPVKQKIGDYYAACMDEKAVEAAGATPLKESLERIDRMHSKRDIAKVAASMRGLNVPVLIPLRSGLQEFLAGDRGD